MKYPTVPMFPLPSYYLFPGAASPLRVFEPRYRAMVSDMLDGPGRLVMACIDPDRVDEMAGNPPVLPIGGLGEIARHRRLPNGEYTMWVVGIGRVRIEEVDSERPYRTAIAHTLEDDHEQSVAPDVTARLQEAIDDRDCNVELPEDAGPGLLADVLAQCLKLPEPLLRACFEEMDVRRRVEFVLGAHQEIP